MPIVKQPPVARGIQELITLKDDYGIIKRSAIATYSDTIHSLIERADYAGPFMPGFAPLSADEPGPIRPAGLAAIDHIVGNGELGKMDEWVHCYEWTMGFTEMIHFTAAAISTEYSALMSKVMQNGSGRIKFPINEPAPDKKKSQIEEYLDYYRGPGVRPAYRPHHHRYHRHSRESEEPGHRLPQHTRELL